MRLRLLLVILMSCCRSHAGEINMFIHFDINFKFVSSAMYCDVIFVKHHRQQQNKVIPLPPCVKGCPDKVILHELEVCDSYYLLRALWM